MVHAVSLALGSGEHAMHKAPLTWSGRRPKDPNGLSWCLCHQADLLVRLNQRTAALSALAEGERIFHKTNDRDGQARVAEIRGRAVSQDQAAAAGWYPDPWRKSELRYGTAGSGPGTFTSEEQG